jgi:hypothetical protein
MTNRRWLTKWRVLGAGVLVLALLVVWWQSAYLRGAWEARRDHSRAHYEVKSYGGPPAPWFDEYTRLLRDRYGVEVHVVAWCQVTNDLVRYADGYNSVSVDRIYARFGKDVFTECAEESRTAWEREHGAER